MNKTLKYSLTAACSLVLLHASEAALIGINFDGRAGGAGSGGLLDPSAFAGVISQSRFNNVARAQYSPPDNNKSVNTTFSNLIDSDAQVTTVSFTISADDSWNSGAGTGSANATLMNGIIKARSAGDDNGTPRQTVVPMSFGGLTPGDAFTIHIYTMENGTGGQYSLSDGTTTYFQEAQNGPAFNETFIQGVNTAPSPGPVANYVTFTGVVGAGGNLPLTYTWISGSDGVGIAGAQIQTTAVPEPTAFLMLASGAGMLGMLRRRRS